MAGAINLMAYIWLVAGEVFEHALDLTIRRLLNRRNSATSLKTPKLDDRFPTPPQRRPYQTTTQPPKRHSLE
jgi:hypothetical protein